MTQIITITATLDGATEDAVERFREMLAAT